MSVEYVITESGMVLERQMSERAIGSLIDQLQVDALKEGVLVPQVLPRVDIMFLANKQILVAQRLTEIPMNTTFELDSSHKIVWAGFREDMEASVGMKLAWKCPADMHLMLLGSGPLYEYSQTAWNFYILAACEQGKKDDPTKRATWLLPLPNQYEDGHMCFNVNLVNPREKIAGWQDTFNAALELLSTAKWAADALFPEWKTVPAKKLFRWENKPGFAQLDSPADIAHWTKCCRSVSLPLATNFFKQWSTAYAIKL